MRWLWLVAIAIGCNRDPDLAEILGPDEVRAGVVTDEAALFGGISAEGQPGDVKIYNDRVRFVIQGLRRGGYYVSEGGGVIDADAARDEGEPGRDLVDEWAGMYGFGRTLSPTSVEVIEDGSDGRALVRVTGTDVPLALLTGALESDLIQPLGLELVTDYVLEPGASWMEVRTTATATSDTTVQIGDLLFGSADIARPWDSGVGFDTPASGGHHLTAYVSDLDDVAVAIAVPPDHPFVPGAASILAGLADLLVGVDDPVSLSTGQSVEAVRYYGAARDLVTLTDALQALEGGDTTTFTGTVTSPDGPVEGARVHVLVDGAPFTLARSGPDGGFSAKVPSGAAVVGLADGRGRGLATDLPDSWVPYGPYGAEQARALSLASIAGQTPSHAQARGRGMADDGEPLALGPEGSLQVTVDDGAPFEVRLTALDPPDEPAPQFGRGRSSGYAAVGWARDGEVTLAVPPGRYHVLVHRGIRFEVDEQEVEVAPTATVEAHLEPAYAHPGWLLGDPHSHAAPSGDGQIPMEDRLLVAAGVGLQVHFGTDHDHVASYRPLLGPLGLEPWLASVVADEISPVMRGHVNAYPLREDRDLPNNGAWSWWEDRVPDTETEFARIRARHGDVVLQLNHPLDKGLPEAAAWSPGRIGNPDKWTEDFDAIEVLNSGDWDVGTPVYLDLVPRGIVPTPTGVSDAHGHLSGSVGGSATFLGVGTDDPGDYTDEALLEAMAAHRTIVTGGPFLDLSIPPGSVITGAVTLDVEALSPSWIVIDDLVLLQDGVEVARRSGTTASFALDPDQDAAFVVVAEGRTPMAPVYPGRLPHALSAAILIDLDGDGWEPPLPPLVLED